MVEVACDLESQAVISSPQAVDFWGLFRRMYKDT